MNSANSVRIQFDTLRVLDFGSISGTYTIVGSKFTSSVRMLKIWNDTDAKLIISYNGTDDQDFLPIGGFIYDYGSNAADTAGNFEQSVKESVSVKLAPGSTATSGAVYVTVISAFQAPQ